jgi:hypothetical protein
VSGDVDVDDYHYDYDHDYDYGLLRVERRAVEAGGGLRSVQGVKLVRRGLGKLRPGLAAVALDELVEPLLGLHLVAQELVGVADIVIGEVELGAGLDGLFELFDRFLILLLLLEGFG